MKQASRRIGILTLILGATMLGVLTVPASEAAVRPRSSAASPETRIAYLHVLQNGKVDWTLTKNVSGVANFHNGIYCIDVAFTPKSLVATMSDEAPSGPKGTTIFVGLPPTMDFDCGDPRANAAVITFIGGTGSPSVAFFATFVG
jgi:hypothetical protein